MVSLYDLDVREWEMLTLYTLEVPSNHDLEMIMVHTGAHTVKPLSVQVCSYSSHALVSNYCILTF